MTLIELLIAMTLMAIGIAAIVAGFSSGVFAIDRTKQATSAATIADQEMEAYRTGPWSSLTVGFQSVCSPSSCSSAGAYWVGTTISWYCTSGTPSPSGSPTTCSGSSPTSNPLKQVSIEVRTPENSDGTTCTTGSTGSCTGKLLYSEVSTFDPSTS